jgi:hypothetical protein
MPRDSINLGDVREPHVLNKQRLTHGPGESYSDVKSPNVPSRPRFPSFSTGLPRFTLETLARREEATRDVRSGIICEGSGYLAKGRRWQLFSA